jgi:hypothetical protein
MQKSSQTSQLNEKSGLKAERVGFEPTERLGRSLDFESSPFDHSGIFPSAKVSLFSSLSYSFPNFFQFFRCSIRPHQ